MIPVTVDLHSEVPKDNGLRSDCVCFIYCTRHISQSRDRQVLVEADDGDVVFIVLALGMQDIYPTVSNFPTKIA